MFGVVCLFGSHRAITTKGGVYVCTWCVSFLVRCSAREAYVCDACLLIRETSASCAFFFSSVAVSDGFRRPGRVTYSTPKGLFVMFLLWLGCSSSRSRRKRSKRASSMATTAATARAQPRRRRRRCRRRRLLLRGVTLPRAWLLPREEEGEGRPAAGARDRL